MFDHQNNSDDNDHCHSADVVIKNDYNDPDDAKIINDDEYIKHERCLFNMNIELLAKHHFKIITLGKYNGFILWYKICHLFTEYLESKLMMEFILKYDVKILLNTQAPKLITESSDNIYDIYLPKIMIKNKINNTKYIYIITKLKNIYDDFDETKKNARIYIMGNKYIKECSHETDNHYIAEIELNEYAKLLNYI